MGPEGGDRGGTVIATGTPEEVAENSVSYTGYYVKKYLEKKLVPNEKTPWLVEKYKKIPIVRIVQYLEKEYGIR